MVIYADEDFYKKEYLQGKATAISAAFPYYFREASQILRRICSKSRRHDRSGYSRFRDRQQFAEIYKRGYEVLPGEISRFRRNQDISGRSAKAYSRRSSISAVKKRAEKTRKIQR